MNARFDRTSILSFAATIAIFATVFAGRFVAAEQPEACDEAARTSDHSIPFLGRIPYLNRLFKHADANGCERIGIDFDLALTKCENSNECAVCPRACKAASQCQECDRCESCPGCPMAGVCVVSSDSQARGMACVECQPGFGMILNELRGACAESNTDLRDALLESRTEAVASQVALAIYMECSDNERALRSELQDSRIENAQLVAKLKFAAEKEELLAELRKAQTENARLENEVKFAYQKGQLLEAAMTAQLERLVTAKVAEATKSLEQARRVAETENAELKTRLAQLESKRSRTTERTARNKASTTETAVPR